MKSFWQNLFKGASTEPAEPTSGKEDPPAAAQHELSDVMASLLSAFVSSKRSMDEKSAELARIYWADPVLRTLPLPIFTLPEVRIQLKIAVVQVSTATSAGAETANPRIRVIVDTPTLEKMPTHLISQVEFKITPQAVKAYQGENEEVLFR